MINSVIDYADHYVQTLKQGLDSFSRKSLQEAFDILFLTYHQGKNVFVCGNGGSASIAEHFVCDHMKGINTDTNLTPRITSLNSNVSLITALANDFGYENVFSKQLEYNASDRDTLVAISSSGNSPNIVNALKKAKDINMHTISLVGFEGGRAMLYSDVCIHVKINNYGICEDAHQNIMHILAQYTRQRYTRKDKIIL